MAWFDRYDATWAAALDSRADWVMVSTWNEWFGGTNVAPATATGVRALEQTAAWSQAFLSQG